MGSWDFYDLKLLWIFEGLIFFGYFLSYLIRVHPIARAQGLKEIVFPFLPALLPFFLIYEIPAWTDLLSIDLTRILRYSPLRLLEYKDWIQGVIALGSLITALALLTLRRAFSIMTEARILVRRGIYAYITHPMYFGQFITFFGVACFRHSLEKWFIYLAFLVFQWMRMKNEEQKLTQVFPEYEAHRKACWIRI